MASSERWRVRGRALKIDVVEVVGVVDEEELIAGCGGLGGGGGCRRHLSNLFTRRGGGNAVGMSAMRWRGGGYSTGADVASDATYCPS
jgi:hypothetical protein